MERLQQEIEEEVRYANITIIEGTGASVYGIFVVSPASQRWCSAMSAR